MSETPKFTVIDRRKFKAEEEHESAQKPATEPETAPVEAVEPGETRGGPRLVVNESKQAAEAQEGAQDEKIAGGLPPAPTAEESHEQKTAYEASAQRVEDLLRAQNPAVGAQPPIGFEQLVQQFYLSAMIQMGAGTQEGQRPRVDIVGARVTIDLLGVLAEKTRGNLTEAEERMLESVLFEMRMAFLELTSMISVQDMPPPPPGKR
ncbi:MAG TPA: DUF1844 domain-containing protein [Terracidiphilus sp.]|nr:DUF1844 domain-containing protein [Terracidiphilus sp.]